MRNRAAWAIWWGLAWITPAMADETLVIYCSEHTPPKHYAEAGVAKGYAVEAARMVALEAGYVPKVVALPWLRAIRESASGSGIITSFSRTTERDRAFLYTDLLLEDAVVLVQAASRPFPVRSLADLSGRRIGTTRGARYSPELNAALPMMVINEDGSPPLRLQMLVAGRLEGALFAGGAPAVAYSAREAGVAMSALRIVSPPLGVDPNFLGVPKAMPQAAAVKARLDAALARLRKNGRLARLLEQAGLTAPSARASASVTVPATLP